MFFAVPPLINPTLSVVYGGSKSRFLRAAIFPPQLLQTRHDSRRDQKSRSVLSLETRYAPLSLARRSLPVHSPCPLESDEGPDGSPISM
jgi:hypothetical protein